MFCIVPLAGPDFFQESYGIKSLISYNGGYLLVKILKSRSWFERVENFIFVMQDSKEAFECREILEKEFSSPSFVHLSTITRGAFFSALAGSCLIGDFEKAIVVDLADIDYDSSSLQPEHYLIDKSCEGYIPFFCSSDPAYSYLKTNEEGFLLQSAEKKVISNKASAGTYFFSNLQVFQSLAEGTIRDADTYAFKRNLFLCPVYNEIVKKGGLVATQEVPLLCSISKQVK